MFGIYIVLAGIYAAMTIFDFVVGIGLPATEAEPILWLMSIYSAVAGALIAAHFADPPPTE